ncbi:hypothetical protein AAC387_Pa04g1861 [Persea americana]
MLLQSSIPTTGPTVAQLQICCSRRATEIKPSSQISPYVQGIDVFSACVCLCMGQVSQAIESAKHPAALWIKNHFIWIVANCCC